MYKVIESNSTGFELTPKPTGRWYRGRSSTHFIPQLISLEKLAAEIQKGVIAPELVEYMKRVKPDPRYRYILVAPLGASEYWGPNNKGDIWPERALNPPEKNAWWGYKTFENAKVFQHHLNKDPNLSIGDIVKAAWNDKMKRVEVIARIDVKKAPPELIEAIDQGKTAEVSMGAKIPEGDVCSICGNRAKSRLFYCEHLKEKMGSIEKDGRYVGAINEKPVFFDLSIVLRPAAEESGILKKVADKKLTSTELGELSLRSTNQSAARSKLLKLASLLNRIVRDEPDISTDLLIKLASYPIETVLSTTTNLGIILKPQEFQTLLLAKENPKVASIFAQAKMTFRPRPVDKTLEIPEQVSEKVADELQDYLFSRSVLEPYLLARILGIEKVANEDVWQEISSEKLRKIATLYGAYQNGIKSYFEKYSPSQVTLRLLVEDDVNDLLKISGDINLLNKELLGVYLALMWHRRYD